MEHNKLDKFQLRMRGAESERRERAYRKLELAKFVAG
jgi:hypothetical protein